MSKSTRKCKLCGNQFDIIKNQYVRFRNGFCEVDCYKKYKLKKGMNLEILEEEIVEMLKFTEEERKIKSQKELEKTQLKMKAKKKELNRKTNLDQLIKYFIEEYDIKVFPKYFYLKLAEINNGTYKGLSSGIPYIDILEMFKLKQKELNGIAHRNSLKNKQMTGISRINYDLAIIISKYDSFLSWKNKQKVIEEINKLDIKKEKEKIQVDYSKLYDNSTNNSKEEDELEIIDILDDIY